MAGVEGTRNGEDAVADMVAIGSARDWGLGDTIEVVVSWDFL